MGKIKRKSRSDKKKKKEIHKINGRQPRARESTDVCFLVSAQGRLPEVERFLTAAAELVVRRGGRKGWLSRDGSCFIRGWYCESFWIKVHDHGPVVFRMKEALKGTGIKARMQVFMGGSKEQRLKKIDLN